MESTGEMELALQYYELSEDYLSLVRVYSYCDNLEKVTIHKWRLQFFGENVDHFFTPMVHQFCLQPSTPPSPCHVGPPTLEASYPGGPLSTVWWNGILRRHFLISWESRGNCETNVWANFLSNFSLVFDTLLNSKPISPYRRFYQFVNPRKKLSWRHPLSAWGSLCNL